MVPHDLTAALNKARGCIPLAAVALSLALGCLSNLALGQDTPDYFKQNCQNCHTIGGGRLTGPDLKDVGSRKEREWLITFMMNPRAVIDSGDEYARKILEESRNVPMPTLPGLSRDRAEKLLDLIDAESKLETSHFKGVQISKRPFTDADRLAGERIFFGLARLENGGAACIACHSVHGQRALGGGALGPDLTRIYERLKGRQALAAWLTAPGTETMLPIFKNRPLTADEIHSLVAWFEKLAPLSEAETQAGRATFLLLGLFGATGLVFSLDAIWKHRFRAVRRPLVGRDPRTLSP